ncbi:hypothetical protein AX15_006600 [Amanita polypyramis BW_CC]|nr:hypothetical protein AX15_006600 [Amanita polypyramis BW_CC]
MASTPPAPIKCFRFLSSSQLTMFQVASHPSAFGLHPHGQYHSPPHYHSPAVKLPRTLARPPFVDVSRDAIAAVAPELEGIPTEYIRRGLRPKANMQCCPLLFPPP